VANELSANVQVAAGRRLLNALQADFSVSSGLITVLSGVSGSGKTTLLRAVAGHFRPDAGRIELAGSVLFDHARHIDLPPERRRVGLVFQSLALFPHLNALENVAYGLPRSVPDREGLALRWLDRMQVAHLAKRRAPTFSGGEAQRVALARTLAAAPRALLLDEPFTALEEPLRLRLGTELQELVRELAIPCLLVTHDRQEAARLGERQLVLESGQVKAR
jgi:molybdate transport system ATP-binding protein